VSIFTPTITRREDKRDSLSLATALCAERSVLGPSNWVSAWAQGKEWARQVSRQRARGEGGGYSAPTACMQARAGRNYTSSSLLATLADTVEGAVSARLRTTSAGQLSVQPRAQRAPHGEVLISPQTHPRPRMEPALGRGSTQQVRRGCT